MRRREFFGVLGGAAAAWPVAARAQQPAMPVVGFLFFRPPEKSAHILAAFREGLREGGYVEGKNVAIEYRFAGGQLERLPLLAADLVQRQVAVIAAGPRAGEVAKSATAVIPIIFMTGADPVRTGLVANLNRPGGNLTGVTMLATELETKRVSLLKDLVPKAATIAVLVDSNNSSVAFQVEEIQAAARSVGVPVQVVSASSERDFDAAFETIMQWRADALIVAASSYFNDYGDRLATLAARHKIPAIYELREFVEAGGLMSYAPSLVAAFRQVGNYTARILKGDKPADLPVMLPTKFEFVINLRTAKALGLSIPPGLLALADEVIE